MIPGRCYKIKGKYSTMYLRCHSAGEHASTVDVVEIQKEDEMRKYYAERQRLIFVCEDDNEDIIEDITDAEFQTRLDWVESLTPPTLEKP
jgi:hypothetical protein